MTSSEPSPMGSAGWQFDSPLVNPTSVTAYPFVAHSRASSMGTAPPPQNPAGARGPKLTPTSPKANVYGLNLHTTQDRPELRRFRDTPKNGRANQSTQVAKPLGRVLGSTSRRRLCVVGPQWAASPHRNI